ncbi:MAG TPA: alpha/beta hydrolase-fold protein [Aggregatilineaceae bacterium]|nr:alpha/beta hydrolase-fold protein [Aggregatilineaceae bacterium]
MTLSASRVEHLSLNSVILKDNPLGDPHVRQLAVYLPTGHDDVPDRTYPTIYLLSSHGNTGPSLMNWSPWDVTIKDQLDALIQSGTIGPVIVVLPDMWTRFGGSQYINSRGMGRYEDYLIHEIIPAVDRNYRTMASREHRGIMGRSSGGYGALVQAMHHPELFGALACHSGDLYWEYTYLPQISRMHQQLQRFGGLDAFIRDIPNIRPKGGAFWDVVSTVCCAAAYGDNPNETRGFDSPIDLETGELNEDVWVRWLEHDPIRKLDQPPYVEALRQMKHIFIDAGQYDEYQLQVGARVLSRKLTALNIPHQYEEYPDGHRHTHYRYEVSLAALYEALK